VRKKDDTNEVFKFYLESDVGDDRWRFLTS